jgi:hypothetical protein
MSRRNGGIIGPTNTPVGGLFKGVAGGVWRMNDVLTFVSNNQWPKVPESIDNSCRFEDGDSPNLSRTPSSASSRTTWTWSAWIKRSNITGGQMALFGAKTGSGSDTGIWFESDETLKFFNNVSGTVKQIRTSAIFRDTSAWYHIVAVWDSTNSTAGDRMRLYINGVEVTSFGTDTNPGDGDESTVNSTVIHQIGRVDSTYHFDGYMAEVAFVDGQALDQTSFGEFDTATGIWKPKKIGSFTSAGDNSFYLDFKDSSNLGNDASGLNNDYTVGGITSLDQGTDTCVVNYATLVNASSASATYTLSEGNLKVEKSASNWYGSPRANMGVRNGKWYYECKVVNKANGFMIGYMSASNLTDVGDRATNNFPKLNGFQASGYIKRQDNTEVNISSSFTWANGDIAQIALDMDNKKLWVGKNGSYYNSGDPASGSNETIGSSYFDSNEDYLPVITMYGTNEGQFNFGNPPYSISSGNSDANGFGNFEYAVPSGYYALNTTNLNTYG